MLIRLFFHSFSATGQLKQAVKLGKPITIHTREADVDTERILKEEVPKDHKVLFSIEILL